MSHLVSRILLAIFLFPVAGMVYLVVFFICDELGASSSYAPGETFGFLLAGAVTWVFAAIYWFSLWRTSVRWTTFRIGGAAGAAAGAALIGAVAGFLVVDATGRSDPSFAAFIATVITILIWLIATVFLWRENRGERKARLGGVENAIGCPNCGYNLTGLAELRCPECGNRFTLGELFAAQRPASVEIE